MSEPFICQKTNAVDCIKQMIEIDPPLYDKCISTAGFAFYFSQLGNRAFQYDAILEILEIGGKFLPHIPVSYEVRMGGANNSPCTRNCPACKWQKFKEQK